MTVNSYNLIFPFFITFSWYSLKQVFHSAKTIYSLQNNHIILMIRKKQECFNIKPYNGTESK